MATLRNIITRGESADIGAVARDPDGSLSDTSGMTGFVTIRRGNLSGEIVLSSALTLVGEQFQVEIDTGDSIWTVGTFMYTVRFTQSGNDFFSEPVQLIIRPSSTDPA